MSRDYGCESVVQRWQSSRVLFLVMERYDESVSLLARVFGRSVATLPEASLRAQRNARSRSAYSDGRISLGDVAAIGAAVATTSCLQHIYVAAHDQFERDLALVAGHHTANSRKTSMKTTHACDRGGDDRDDTTVDQWYFLVLRVATFNIALRAYSRRDYGVQRTRRLCPVVYIDAVLRRFSFRSDYITPIFRQK